MDAGNYAWMLTSSALVLIMTPGLAFFYGGLAKRKSVVNTMMSSVFIMGLVSILWVVAAYSLAFSNSGNGGVIGDLNWLFLNHVQGADKAVYLTPDNITFCIFQMMFAIITPALITGAIIERMKFSSLFLFIAAWLFVVYVPLAHMVWGGGFLGKTLGVLDFAGGDVVHISSGVSALVLAILLGRRRNVGRAPYKPHNVPFVFLGAALLWFGWFGFNAGSAGAANALASHAFMTTNTAAAAAMLSWILIEAVARKKPTLVGASTGIVIGLVAITPAAGFVPIWASILIGALVSPICYFFITVVKPKFGYDDALDVFGCHGIGGIWGGIATGLFAMKDVNSLVPGDGLLVGGGFHQFGIQLAGIGITIGIAVAGTLVCAGLARLVTGRLRVSEKEEDLGLDYTQHGEAPYPAFKGLD